MGSDAAEAEDILPIPSSFKVHRTMCEELMRLVNRAMTLLPQIEEARPRCSSGIQALCSLNQAIEKAKLLLQYCNEASKLYLVYTADAILSRCERSRKALELSLVQIQSNVPVLLAIEISRLVDDIRSATFELDSSEEEAGELLRKLVHRGASDSTSVENFELNSFQSAVLRLHVTSQKAILIEKRSIKKLLNKIGNTDPKKKKILTYFFYLFKQYGNQIPAEQAEPIYSTEPASNGSNTFQPHVRESSRVETRTIPGDALSDPMLLEEFKCPLSSRLMYDPVVIASGQTFERVWIEKWFEEGNDTCPKTKLKLDNLSVIPNTKMKELISKWCKKYGISIPQPREELELEAMPSLDHSSMSIRSIESSVNDLHLHVDLSNVSFGSLDTSFSSESSIPRMTGDLAMMSRRANENSRRKSLESIRKLPELPWASQCDLVEDFRCRVEQNGESLCSGLSERFITPIVKFLGEAIQKGDIKAQRSVAQLFLAYLKKSRHGTKYLTEEFFSHLANLLYSSDEVKGEALAIVENLSSEPMSRPKITSSGVLALVSDVLSSRSRDLQGSALRILQNISSDNYLLPLVFSLDSIVPKLIPFLKDTKLSRHALSILSNLCDVNEARISITETSGCIALMAELLENGDGEEKEIVLSIFMTLCSQRLEYCHLVMHEGIIPSLVHLTSNGTEKSKACALELLRQLREVDYVESPRDRDPEPEPEPEPGAACDWPREPSSLPKGTKKSSSLRLFGIFSRPKR